MATKIKRSSALAQRIILVGSPNVGKSLLFNHLTHSYTTVSNYPGTSVDIFRGKAVIRGKKVEIIDTPGMYSFFALTEEERVARRVLFDGTGALVLQVVDAKNLTRMLPLTLQLLEAGFQVILVLNMMDEAEKWGIDIDTGKLAELLGIPVVPTTLVKKKGITVLKREILKSLHENRLLLQAPTLLYPPLFEEAISRILPFIKGNYGIKKKALALLLLCGDKEIENLVQKKERQDSDKLIKNLFALREKMLPSPLLILARFQLKYAGMLLKDIMKKGIPPKEKGLGYLTVKPLTGIPAALLLLYFGLYKFVGGFGAGYLVDLFENIYQTVIAAWARGVTAFLPESLAYQLVAGEYGVLTFGLRYAVAIVLPIVGTFFFFFSLLEDSGYLPRLALLTDRALKVLGLSGRAVIPLTLGLGCGTMAVIVTRTLETKREQIIATFLLALAIPCSAQLGLFAGILSYYPGAVIIWATFIMLALLAAGTLADKLAAGDKPVFYMDIPPLRIPSLKNIGLKTASRLIWYFKEVLPVFLSISLLLAVADYYGLINLVTAVISPVIRLLGLPQEMSLIFVLGFLRRDYGAAGLYDLFVQGSLSFPAVVISAVTMTLFLPCLAQLAVMIKERGIFTTFVILSLVAAIALSAGYCLRLFFLFLGMEGF